MTDYNQINNPILKGFNPDPSIIRVDQDYYIATSSFEWFPGIQIHHSKDLVNWQLIARPLDRISLLDLKGVPDSCGVWAPCLSYHDGLYYLVYSQVRSFDGHWKDTPNYLTVSESITGPWSDPVFLDCSGFDGSMYHEGDKSYYLSMQIDFDSEDFFGGIIIQEYSRTEKYLLGNPRLLFKGSSLGCTEGPHIFKRGGFYYLVAAEGGTEYNHAVSILRSKQLTGPYDLHPDNPILSKRDQPDFPLQKTGHADIVFTDKGETFMVFLCGRPLGEDRRCILGRETSIVRLSWKEGWPYVSDTDAQILNVDLSQAGNRGQDKCIEYIDLRKDKLSIHYQSLRVPEEDFWRTYGHYGLRLQGRESLSSCFEQSLLARRIQSFNCRFRTALSLHEASSRSMAGLVCYYNTGHYYYLCLGYNNEAQRIIKLYVSNNFDLKLLFEENCPGDNSIELKMELNKDRYSFYYGHYGKQLSKIPGEYDSTILSDDYVREGGDRYRPAFTGSFVGIACQDLAQRQCFADFSFVEYQEL